MSNDGSFTPYIVTPQVGDVIFWNGQAWVNGSADESGTDLIVDSLTIRDEGNLVLQESDGDYVAHKAPSAVGASYTLTWPVAVSAYPVGMIVSNTSGTLSFLPTWTPVKKAADETRNTDDTMTADGALKFTMAANTDYIVRGIALFATEATPDFKYDFNGPAGASIRVRTSTLVPGSTNARAGVETSLANAVAITATGAGAGFVQWEGRVSCGGTGGAFQFRWAQNTSDAGDTTVHEGSYLEYQAL